MTENEALKSIIEDGIELNEGDYVELEALEVAAKALEEIQKYREIGTVEECREAREKQRAKKRNLDSYCGFNNYECPACGAEPVEWSNFCHKCGQRLE